MTHKNKLRLARSMMIPAEIKAHVPPFQSEAWNKRLVRIEKEVKKREANAKEASRLRKLNEAKLS